MYMMCMKQISITVNHKNVRTMNRSIGFSLFIENVCKNNKNTGKCIKYENNMLKII